MPWEIYLLYFCQTFKMSTDKCGSQVADQISTVFTSSVTIFLIEQHFLYSLLVKHGFSLYYY